MQSKIKQLFDDIKERKSKASQDLHEEYSKLKQKYDLKLSTLSDEYIKLKEKYEFRVEWRKIIWNKEREKELKKDKKSVWDSIFSATVRELLSIPFIWMMLIPAIFIDIFMFIYQNTAIRLYKIPLARRSDYIVFDRGQLAYLNWIQKINCIYCSYFNWLMQYSVEVAWRTEKYWCPIKHATKKEWIHDWEEHFAEYWDSKWFKETFRNIDEYKKAN